MAASKHVIALVDFYDRKEGVNRVKGEEFDVTASRLAELNACGKEQCYKPLVSEKRAPKAEEVSE